MAGEREKEIEKEMESVSGYLRIKSLWGRQIGFDRGNSFLRFKPK